MGKSLPVSVLEVWSEDYQYINSCYVPLQLWSSTHMGHIFNGLGVHILV